MDTPPCLGGVDPPCPYALLPRDTRCRGLCRRCYARAARRVAEGYTTWCGLVSIGRAGPAERHRRKPGAEPSWDPAHPPAGFVLRTGPVYCSSCMPAPFEPFELALGGTCGQCKRDFGVPAHAG